MNLFFPLDLLLPGLWLGASMLAFGVVGLLLHGWLADRVVFEGRGRVDARNFDRVDAAIAGALSLLCAAMVYGSLTSNHPRATQLPTDADMIGSVVATTAIFWTLIAAFVGSLVVRKISCVQTFGLNQAGFAKIVTCAILLLLSAYPLIYGAMSLTRLVLAAAGYVDDDPQEIVRYLGSGGHRTARLVVAFSTVVLAPIQEELIFRGYLYGVFKRYAGVGVGVVVNALLFAGIHQNAQIFGALFTLAVCLTLAYEWTGSILVSMAIHSLFNFTTVYALLTGASNV